MQRSVPVQLRSVVHCWLTSAQYPSTHAWLLGHWASVLQVPCRGLHMPERHTSSEAQSRSLPQLVLWATQRLSRQISPVEQSELRSHSLPGVRSEQSPVAGTHWREAPASMQVYSAGQSRAVEHFRPQKPSSSPEKVTHIAPASRQSEAS